MTFNTNILAKVTRENHKRNNDLNCTTAVSTGLLRQGAAAVVVQSSTTKHSSSGKTVTGTSTNCMITPPPPGIGGWCNKKAKHNNHSAPFDICVPDPTSGGSAFALYLSPRLPLMQKHHHHQYQYHQYQEQSLNTFMNIQNIYNRTQSSHTVPAPNT